MAPLKNTDKQSSSITPIGKVLLKLEEPKNISRMILGLAVLCALLFMADFFHLRHGKFSSEDLFGFYGVFGFLAFAFIIFATKVLKKLLERNEDFYAPDAVDSEEYPAHELDVKEHENV